MISKKTYIPAKPRNKKLIGGMMVASGSTVSGGPQHSHANKDVIDRLTQPNIDVLSKLSLYQTGVEMVQAVDEFGAPIVDEFGAPVMIEKLVPVIDSFGNPVLDLNGDPVMETVAVYAVKSSVSIISEKEITAYGLGEEEGGGGSYDMLLSWENYTSEKSNWVISAALGKGLHDRVSTLEAGGVGGSVAWADITGKPSTFAPSAHSHAEYAAVMHSHVISDVSGLETALSGKAPSSHSHGWSEITGKPSTFTPSAHSHGVADISGLSATLGSYVTVDTTQTITGAKTFSEALTASTSVSTPILNLGNGWTIEAGTSKIEVKQSGTVRARFESTGFVSAGEITAYN
jgi:hypothetical protein